ncbi:uncharacterized protein NFIA_099690 [Aspergillus fischeri NRRL 181]|uniref:Secreted protein CSS2 C-terminal domain-containing protein n=1 Tax=Neosartorya fischeri (strain ATCC 1020 / DSM 3700 / CBS 544.65 / FGSC A1164 / JCM 1740 / NRRL 181 / WB 181) TaxID=331117 RepID=A1DBU3_NEOFI|nr:uncharacterized protein NFIA_099690 [Aspergillus fischeri NRRL 181]EAW20333.1 hypothetical protein NFIA_099690 [Aspergillus fischeri NRRL 181]
MVKLSKVLCGVLAWVFAAPCLAGDNETTYVTTTPIFMEWDNGASNMTVTLGLINANYAWKYVNNTLDVDLDKRTGITITKIKTTVKAGTKIIATVKAGIEIYEFLAGIIKSKSDANSCTLTYGTDR